MTEPTPSAAPADEGPLRWRSERGLVLAAAQALANEGLVVGASGNVSMRLDPPTSTRPSLALEGLLAITPSRRAYASLAVEDVQVIDFEGDPVEGDLIPSVETMMHVEVYRARPDVLAVVHSHPVFASVLAVAWAELPPVVDELVIATGGPVPVAEYAFSGSEELAAAATRALGADLNAVILRNHGLLTVGVTPAAALQVAGVVERCAQIYVHARLLGAVHLLPAEVVAAEVELARMLRER